MMKKNQELFESHSLEMKSLETLYIGGGTPSLWGERGASFLNECFKDYGISLSGEGEFTLEVNPGSWTREGIKEWQNFGINRFSLGIQSLRGDYLKLLDRVHSVEDVFETLEYFKKIQASFSVDFMLGLPWSHEKERNILEELEEILAYGPEHLSLYILTAKGGYPHKEFLPDEVFIESEYLKVAKHLKNQGYSHYEVSNFSKPGKESLHNKRYWQSRSVASLGPSAVGFLATEQLRYKWKVTKAEYEEELLSEESFKLEKLYMGLRIDEGIFIKDHFSPREAERLEPLLHNWCKEGFSVFDRDNDHLKLTSHGFLILDGLMQQLFSIQNA